MIYQHRRKKHQKLFWSRHANRFLKKVMLKNKPPADSEEETDGLLGNPTAKVAEVSKNELFPGLKFCFSQLLQPYLISIVCKTLLFIF